jgi:hypothetical protein
MILIKFVVLCFIVFLCASPSCELVVFDPGKWLYRTRSEGLTGYSCLSVLLPLRVRLGHLSWNNSGYSATYPLPYSCIYFHIFIIKDLSISLFFALNAKGGKLIGQSKRTTPPPYF